MKKNSRSSTPVSSGSSSRGNTPVRSIPQKEDPGFRSMFFSSIVFLLLGLFFLALWLIPNTIVYANDEENVSNHQFKCPNHAICNKTESFECNPGYKKLFDACINETMNQTEIIELHHNLVNFYRENGRQSIDNVSKVLSSSNGKEISKEKIREAFSLDIRYYINDNNELDSHRDVNYYALFNISLVFFTISLVLLSQS